MLSALRSASLTLASNSFDGPSDASSPVCGSKVYKELSLFVSIIEPTYIPFLFIVAKNASRFALLLYLNFSGRGCQEDHSRLKTVLTGSPKNEDWVTDE